MINVFRFAAPTITGIMLLAAGASQAASVSVTATYEVTGRNAYYYKTTDMIYSDGSTVSANPIYVFCIDGPLSHYAPGTLQNFTASTSYTFKSGTSDWGLAAMSYVLDNYYTPYIVNADDGYSVKDRADNRGFQEAIWDISYDFDGTAVSLNNLRSDAYTSYLTIVSGIQAAIGNGELTSSYRSSIYEVFFLSDANPDYQDWIAFTTSDVDLPTPSPVPLPAGAGLLLSGIGAFVAVRRKKRT